MTPTETLSAEALEVYDIWLNSYLTGDVKTYDHYLDDDYRFIGSTGNEEFLSKKETTQFFEATADQLAGKTDVRNSNRTVQQMGDLLFITQLLDGWFLNEKEWFYYGRFRFTSVMRKRKNEWKFIYQHFSMPDSKAETGDTIGYDQVNKENVELRDAIKRRTKELEQKSRELEIEAALERVRSRSMAMHQSEELAEVIQVVYDQLVGLHIPVDHAGFILDYKERDDMHIWLADHQQGVPSEITIPYFDSPHWNSFVEAKAKGENFFANLLDLEEKNKFYKDLIGLIPPMPEETIQNIFDKPGLTISTVLLDNVGLYIENYSGTPFTDEENATLMRFGKAFQQTYTRFLDLQKAEALTREGQIELGLERVRARAMAMKSSNELKGLIGTVYEELTKLNLSLDRCLIWIINREDLSTKLWMADTEGIPVRFYVPYHESPPYLAFLEGWKEGNTKWEYDLRGETKKEWDDYVFSKTDMKHLPDPVKKRMQASEQIIMAGSFQQFGCLQTAGSVSLTEEQYSVLNRFAKVFDSTYTRFNDLQRAEAQARESQIEAAVERIRAQSMAMHHTDDLHKVTEELLHQLNKLSVDGLTGTTIYLVDANDIVEAWDLSSPGSIGTPGSYTVTYNAKKYPVLGGWVKEWRTSDQNYFALEFPKEALLKAVEEWKNVHPEIAVVFKNAVDSGKLTHQWSPAGRLSKGILAVDLTKPPTEDTKNIVTKMSGAFNLAYQRFEDLQKAEAQSRESQVELALERIRAKTMAMQSSEELADVAFVLFEQLRRLGGNLWGTGFGLCEKDSNEDSFWFANENGVFPPVSIPNTTDPAHQQMFEGWKVGKDFLAKEASGKDLKSHYDYMLSLPEVKPFFQKILDEGLSFPEWQQWNAAYFKHGYLLIITLEPYPDSDILVRFAKVFDQTYTRFLDLQKAEAQAREAKIETSLERVRSRTMAMHKSDELGEVAAVLFEQVSLLTDTPNRFNIGIIKDEIEGVVELWVTDQNGKKIDKLFLAEAGKSTVINGLVEGWKAPENRKIQQLKGKELENWIAYIGGEIGVPFNTEKISKQRCISSIFFKEGFMGITTDEPIEEDTLILLERFAALFQQSYTRFLDLQRAEGQTREAEIQLALERVRAKSMAMHKSEELLDVITVVSDQLQQLNFRFDHVSFANNEIDQDYKFWSSVRGMNPVRFNVPYVDIPIFTSLKSAQQNGAQFHTDILTQDENREWHQHLLKHGGSEVFSKEMNEYTMGRGMARSIALNPNIILILANYASVPYSEEDNKIIARFGRVFEQSYTRFLDLQNAESQAREAKIETALEKVRSRTMGMQKSDELADVANVLFEEMNGLVHNLWTCGFVLCEKDREEDEWWLSLEDGFSRGFFLPNVNDCAHAHLYEGWLKKDEFRTVQLEGDDLQAHYDWLMEVPVAKSIFDEMEAAGMQRPEWQKLHAAYFSKGYLVIITREPCSEEAIFKRFAQVFDLTYTRFLDLQKAEAQAREAQIENALEKVRSRSLAMQSPDELIEVAELLREEMGALGVEELETSSIYIHNNESGTTQCWFTIKDTTKPGKNITDQMTIDLQDTWVGREMNDFYRSTEKRTSIRMLGEQRIEWMRYCEEKSDLFTTSDFYGDTIPDRTYHLYKFSNGYIGAASPGEISDESWDLLKRATSVFSFAYTRFLDLRKAKEQTREAQIELSLERIRAQVTGMQESSDLLDIVVTMRTEFVNLGHEAHYFWHMRWLPDTYKKAMTSGDGTKIGMVMTLPRHIHGDIPPVAKWEKSKEPTHILAMDIDAAVDYVDKMISLGDFERVDPQAPTLDDIRHIGGLTFVMARTTHGEIGFSLPGVVPDPPKVSVDTLVRFAGVFDLAYRRFEDLKKAEAQARENRIELALERTRNQSMLMQHSDEIKGISDVFHQQLLELNIPSEFSYVWLPDESKNNHQFWASWAEQKKGELIFKSKQVTYPLDKTEPYTAACYKAWEDQENVHMELIPPADISSFFDTWAELLDGAKNLKAKHFPDGVYYAEAYMRYGCFGINIRRELSTEEKQVLKRFSIEFERAYTRFLDLKKSEARARESQVELSLERIRGQVTAMQESSDLFDIVVSMRKEFISLGNEADYFWHMRWLPDVYDMSMTSEDGSRVGMVISIPKFVHDNIPALAEWEKGNDATYALALDADSAWDYIEAMNTHGHYEQADPNAPTREDIEHIGGLTFVIARTTHGEIGYSLPGMVPNPPKEALDTLVRFAGVFDLAYKRFEDLKTAEKDLIEIKQARQKAEDALIELKATQTQLVQQEKLASLGQLTAGIAHEIKNPLNFVNNFSEVSVELIDEAFEELEKLDDSDAKEEIIAILNDVKSNLTKVHEHGSRADSIVKSMLQHSRGGSGKMEPTNLNALVKEYTNLAFHGMRAGKNPINAEIDLQLDPKIKTIPMIGEDFSRVVLNLCNNAFDAMRETADSRPPKLSVRTHKTDKHISIEVEDNGPGIPDDLKDKILQPFFTTKKGTEGTGLGLSITNDIIKAHGGSLDIHSKPGQTIFQIHLTL